MGFPGKAARKRLRTGTPAGMLDGRISGLIASQVDVAACPFYSPWHPPN
jgi:hypothetical protein